MTKIPNDRLQTILLPPATEFSPVEGRKYTMTHSDVTGQLFVSIGYVYDYSKITQMRDEVLAEWVPHVGQYVLLGKVYVTGGEYDENTTKIRYMIFKKEMETAIQAIVQGDEAFFCHFPWFLDFPIYIHFESVNHNYNHVLYFGTPRYYINKLSENAHGLLENEIG